jgi:hypothetical protein
MSFWITFPPLELKFWITFALHYILKTFTHIQQQKQQYSDCRHSADCQTVSSYAAQQSGLPTTLQISRTETHNDRFIIAGATSPLSI